MRARFPLGTVIEKVAQTLGVTPCSSCGERKRLLNEGKYKEAMISFIGVKKVEANNDDVSRPTE